MLIKHQSFEISQRRKSQKQKRNETLYEAKKYPYLKFILVPGIIGFMLLCILVNVNFTEDVEKPRENANSTAGHNHMNLTSNITEFWQNENESETRSSSHQNSKEIKRSKQNVLVVHENRVTNSREINIQQQSVMETIKVLPTEFVKAQDGEVNVLPTAAMDSKSLELNSESLELTPTILKPVTNIIETQELKPNEYGLLGILKTLAKADNRVNKYDKAQILNNKFENYYKDFNYKSQETDNNENIFGTSTNGKLGKIGSTTSKSTFTVVKKQQLTAEDTVTKFGNAFLTVRRRKSEPGYDKSLLNSRQMAEEQPQSYSPVDNTRSIPSRILKTGDILRIANSSEYKRQQEYKNNPEKSKVKQDISIKFLQTIAPGSYNDIFLKVGSTSKFQDVFPYQQQMKTNVEVSHNGGNTSVQFHKAVGAQFVGNAKNVNFIPVRDIEDERNGLTNGNEIKSNEWGRNFVSAKDTKQLSRETGNIVRFPTRQLISKGFSISKFPEPNTYNEFKYSNRKANKDLPAPKVHTMNEPTEYRVTKVTIDEVGNAMPQYVTKTRGQYNKSCVKLYASLKDANVRATVPYKPEIFNINEISREISNHFTESTNKLDAVLKNAPNNLLSNNLKPQFKTTQTVGSAVLELPTKLIIKESQYTGIKYYNVKGVKQISPEVGNTSWKLKTHIIESNSQYSENRNQFTTIVSQSHNAVHTQQQKQPWKWSKTPLEMNTTLAVGNTVTKILNQTMHRRTARQVENNLELASTTSAVNAIKCTRFNANCTLICDTGGLSHLDDDLEDFQIGCYNKDLTLELRNCVFADGIMKSNFLNGFYSLQELQIINCNLATIQNGVFKGRGVKKLQTLKFVNNSIVSLTASTFDGLTVLKHFQLSQHVMGDKSVGNNFLTPMALTLTNIKIMQTFDNNAVLDPTEWLQGPDFVALYIVDLENNNLQGVLKPETFKCLTALGILSLQSCSLETIDIKPFEHVLDTLYSLYLNNNNLVTLDPTFLDHITENQIVLSAKGNEWQCDCDHSAMIDYVKNEGQNQYITMEDFICKNPQEWGQTHMVNVTLNCEGVTTITTSQQPDTTSSQNTEGMEPTTKSTTKVAISPTTTVTLETTTPDSTTDMATSPTTVTLQTTTPHSTTSDMATYPTTDPLDTTTPADTTDTPNLASIICRSHNSALIFTISLKTRTADLTIKQSTLTSVTIISSKDTVNYRITYFLQKTQYSTIQPTSTAEWNINNLNEMQTYIFCLHLDSDATVSPFDCWAHFMGNSAMNNWLLTSDKGWFVSVIIIAAVLSCLTGGAATYFVLRQRPCWLLMSSERVLRVHHSSPKIVLLPKRSSIIRRVSSNSDQSGHQTRTVSYLSPEPLCDRYSSAPSSVYASLNKPPTQCAPTLPGIVKRYPYSGSCNLPPGGVHPNNVTGQMRWSFRTEENDYGYKTIDHYEEIRF